MLFTKKFVVVSSIILIFTFMFIVIKFFNKPGPLVCINKNHATIHNKQVNEKTNIKKYTIPVDELRDFDVNDSHNVHNRPIQRENNKIIPLLFELNQNNQNMYLPIDIYYEIKEKDEHTTNEKIKYILKTIKDLDLLYCSKKEIDIIENVWKRIHITDNIDNYQYLTDRFKEALLDTINENFDEKINEELKENIHCKWGRINRIIQTLQHIDPQIHIKYMPMWMLKDLIVYKIIQIKNIKQLKVIFDDEYIKTGILTQSELDLIVNDYYAAIDEQ